MDAALFLCRYFSNSTFNGVQTSSFALQLLQRCGHMPKPPSGVGTILPSNRMKKDLFENLETLSDIEITYCNGGSVAIQAGKVLFPPIVYPLPDPEDKGRL